MKKTKKITVGVKVDIGFAAISPHGWVLFFSIRPTRRQAVQVLCDNYGLPWAEAKHEGFRVAKVRVIYPSVKP